MTRTAMPSPRPLGTFERQQAYWRTEAATSTSWLQMAPLLCTTWPTPVPPWKSWQRNLERSSDKGDQLIASARDTFDRSTKLASDLDALVQASRPGLRELTTNGVAQLDELLAETRRLVASLNRVSTGLERDPSGLLLGVRREGYRPK